jgi:hypothetical protein
VTYLLCTEKKMSQARRLYEFYEKRCNEIERKLNEKVDNEC